MGKSILGALLAVQVSFGLGIDIEDDSTHFESKDYKGILQIEGATTNGSYSYGFWHSSRLEDGLKGNPDDQNIIYIKKNFKF